MASSPETATIFISIASYRDQFLPFTIRSALAQASHPERLTFGICWQSDEEENLDEWLDDPRFRIRRYPYQSSLGYGWSRVEVQKLYADEEYHLLIDSHTWFAKGWDDNLIKQLESKPSERPLLTTSSPPFTFDEQGEVVIPWAGTDMDGVPLMRCELIPPVGWIDIQMSPKRKTEEHEKTPLVCCNFVFTHGRWIREVPEDPAMINAAHESALSLRTFTHGYDIYLRDAKSDKWQQDNTDGMIRRLHALFFGKEDPRILGRYTLGTERSVDEWAKEAGLKLML
jgi:hypothetical protein